MSDWSSKSFQEIVDDITKFTKEIRDSCEHLYFPHYVLNPTMMPKGFNPIENKDLIPSVEKCLFCGQWRESSKVLECMNEKMKFKKVLKYDSHRKIYRLFRIIWNKEKISYKFSVALSKKFFYFKRDWRCWELNILFFRFQFKESSGGRFV